MSLRGAGVRAAMVAILLTSATPAAAHSVATKRFGFNRSRREKPVHEQPAPQAPGGQPLGAEGMSVERESSSAPPSGGDALVENGLGSPMCREWSSRLSAEVKRSCELGGFVGAPDPVGDYALDVNINTPLGDIGNYLATTIQNFTGFGWMVFVSVTQGLIVMLEWCYSLDRLTGELLSQIASALRGARMTLTEPWMAATLSVAAILVAYHGLVRRRIAETLGQALAMFAMMAVGLWLIADPVATIGVLDNWANQAGLGTLSAVASGSPESPERTFASDMRRLFGATIDSPWCYMEFGNVGWCRGALDPNLRKAALAIADKEQAESGCRSLCGIASGPKNRLLAASAALLREAKSNEELFLALPADEPARNSTKHEWSLLSVLCGGGERSADKCTGPTAAQAEFRSEKGTQSRLIGLFLVWLGGLGMLALLGFLALHLLTAVIRTIVFLLLAPAAVLAPAFGEGGRSLFRTWLTRLLAAAVSKLIYSFVLGVVLLMVYLLLRLTVLGWWGQWLVLSAFWWGVFVKRHEISALVEGPAQNRQRARHPSLPRMRWPLRKTTDKIKEKLRSPVPEPPKRPPAKKDPDQTRHESDKGQAEDQSGTGGETNRSTSAPEKAQEPQVPTGDWDGQATRILEALKPVSDADPSERLTGSQYTPEQREQRSRFLDAQAALPPAGRKSAEGVARDYAALAGLAGYGAEEYAALAPLEQRETRLQIDRELADRVQRMRDVSRAPTPGQPSKAPFDESADSPSGARPEGANGGPSGNSSAYSRSRSPVMDDAFAVERRRKRQLGREILD